MEDEMDKTKRMVVYAVAIAVLICAVEYGLDKWLY
jgi:hypothetical protein